MKPEYLSIYPEEAVNSVSLYDACVLLQAAFHTASLYFNHEENHFATAVHPSTHVIFAQKVTDKPGRSQEQVGLLSAQEVDELVEQLDLERIAYACSLLLVKIGDVHETQLPYQVVEVVGRLEKLVQTIHGVDKQTAGYLEAVLWQLNELFKDDTGKSSEYAALFAKQLQLLLFAESSKN